MSKKIFFFNALLKWSCMVLYSTVMDDPVESLCPCMFSYCPICVIVYEYGPVCSCKNLVCVRSYAQYVLTFSNDAIDTTYKQIIWRHPILRMLLRQELFKISQNKNIEIDIQMFMIWSLEQLKCKTLIFEMPAVCTGFVFKQVIVRPSFRYTIQ